MCMSVLCSLGGEITLQLSQSNALYPEQSDQRVLCFPYLGIGCVVWNMDCEYSLDGNTSQYSEMW